MSYDGDGNRVAETVGGVATQYLIDDRNPTGLPQVIDELVNGAVTKTYVYGLQRISENQQIGGAWTPSLVPQVRAPLLGANLGGACSDVTAFPRARALDFLG